MTIFFQTAFGRTIPILMLELIWELGIIPQVSPYSISNISAGYDTLWDMGYGYQKKRGNVNAAGFFFQKNKKCEESETIPFFFDQFYFEEINFKSLKWNDVDSLTIEHSRPASRPIEGSCRDKYLGCEHFLTLTSRGVSTTTAVRHGHYRRTPNNRAYS